MVSGEEHLAEEREKLLSAVEGRNEKTVHEPQKDSLWTPHPLCLGLGFPEGRVESWLHAAFVAPSRSSFLTAAELTETTFITSFSI